MVEDLVADHLDPKENSHDHVDLRLLYAANLEPIFGEVQSQQLEWSKKVMREGHVFYCEESQELEQVFPQTRCLEHLRKLDQVMDYIIS